jgi:hypothetical protein
LRRLKEAAAIAEVVSENKKPMIARDDIDRKLSTAWTAFEKSLGFTF